MKTQNSILWVKEIVTTYIQIKITSETQNHIIW